MQRNASATIFNALEDGSLLKAKAGSKRYKFLASRLLNIAGSYYSFSKYVELRKGSDSSGGNLVQDFDVSISFTQNLRAYTANKNTWLFLGECGLPCAHSFVRLSHQSKCIN